MQTAISRIQTLLLEAIQLEGAIKGTLQRYRKETNELEIIASEGFTSDFLSHFKSVKPFDSSCCGRAFGSGRAIIINDVEKDPSFKPNLEIANQAGYKAVKSVPIYSPQGQKVGVISIHFKEPKSVWNTEKLDFILTQLSEVFEQNPELNQR